MNKLYLLCLLLCIGEMSFSQKQIFADTTDNQTVIIFEGCIENRDTVKDGLHLTFEKNGFLTATHFKNNQEHGVVEKRYMNGLIFEKYTMKHGKAHGLYIKRFSTGEIYLKGRYRNGEKTGRWITFSVNGDTLSSGKYLGKSCAVIAQDSLIYIIHKTDTLNIFESNKLSPFSDEPFNTYGSYGPNKIHLKKGKWIYSGTQHVHTKEKYNKRGILVEFYPQVPEGHKKPPKLSPLPHE
jgi:antitoxin component YwqK of YwqJK toxin-antitoxin module